MNNRLTSGARALIAAGLLLVAANGAWSAEPVEGKEYKLLKPAQPSEAAPGKVGVVAKDAYADLLLLDGNPLDDINVLAGGPAKMRVIMKGGQFVKRETVQSARSDRPSLPGP